ncbi:MAG: caffeoyl-CoA O-methyltransferase [Limisphaerales bacterium]|jgi:caffeoyl-CoA O-methyltransferase
MSFISEELNEYARQHSTPESPLLEKLHKETLEETFLPHMISGHIQGRFLSMMSKLIRPKRVLEIGTFTCYSAICIAEGLQEGGRIDTIDIDRKKVERIHRYIKESGKEGVIHFHFGRGQDIIPGLEGDFDMVFIDGDKQGYPHYFDILIDRIVPGGIILVDNCLWHGKVLEDKDDVGTIGIKSINDKIQADPRVENVLLPLEDGIMVARKIG